MIGALISWGFAALFQVVTLLLVIEGYLMWTGHSPITWYVRRAEWAFPGPSVAIVLFLAAAIGALFAHFVWDAKKDEPPTEQPK